MLAGDALKRWTWHFYACVSSTKGTGRDHITLGNEIPMLTPSLYQVDTKQPLRPFSWSFPFRYSRVTGLRNRQLNELSACPRLAGMLGRLGSARAIQLRYVSDEESDRVTNPASLPPDSSRDSSAGMARGVCYPVCHGSSSLRLVAGSEVDAINSVLSRLYLSSTTLCCCVRLTSSLAGSSDSCIIGRCRRTAGASLPGSSLRGLTSFECSCAVSYGTVSAV
jgi:hypothetical protein